MAGAEVAAVADAEVAVVAGAEVAVVAEVAGAEVADAEVAVVADAEVAEVADAKVTGADVAALVANAAVLAAVQVARVQRCVHLDRKRLDEQRDRWRGLLAAK